MNLKSLFSVFFLLFVLALATNQNVNADCAGPSDEVSETLDRDDSQGWLCCGYGSTGLVQQSIEQGHTILFTPSGHLVGSIDAYAEADSECITNWLLMGVDGANATVCSKRAVRIPAHSTTCLDFNEEETGCCIRELTGFEETVTECETEEDGEGAVIGVNCVTTSAPIPSGVFEIVATTCVQPQVVEECDPIS